MSLREIDTRDSDGISVALLWDDSAKNDSSKHEFQVKVCDLRDEKLFTLLADNFSDAREAFYHPYGVANFYLKSGRMVSTTAV